MTVARHTPVVFALFAAGVAMSLAACGGGGGGGAMPAPSPRPSNTALLCATGQSVGRRSFVVDGRSYVMSLPRKSEHDAWSSSQIWVRFANSTYHSSTASALQSLHALPDGIADRAGYQVFDLPRGQDVDQAVAAMQHLPGVTHAGKIALRSLLALSPNPPNDPAYTPVEQWDLHRINVDTAWNITTGSPTVHIAIIDTGYDTSNPDLNTKVDLAAVFVSGSPSNSVQDCDGHGSNVSGIAAAATNNGQGVAGVGYDTRLLEARVFPHGINPMSSEADIANAINWAVTNNANVISLSLGSTTDDPPGPEDAAIANAISRGVIVVAAAGNDFNPAGIDFPAARPGVIAVGATSLHDLAPNQLSGATEYVAAYSNFSSELDVVAPGGDPSIFQQNCQPPTAGCPDFLQWITNLYSIDGLPPPTVGSEPFLQLFAGTSQATPHVAGLAALMVAKAQADGKPLSPAIATQLIQLHAANISDPHQGFGRIDAQATLSDPSI